MRAALITDVSAPDAGGVLTRVHNARSAVAYLMHELPGDVVRLPSISCSSY
jgi:hypothetical protein